jgi:hypothetical protein
MRLGFAQGNDAMLAGDLAQLFNGFNGNTVRRKQGTFATLTVNRSKHQGSHAARLSNDPTAAGPRSIPAGG